MVVLRYLTISPYSMKRSAKKSKFRAYYNFNGYPGQYFYFKDLDAFIRWLIPRLPRKFPIQLQVLNRWNHYVNVPASEWKNSQLDLFNSKS